MSEKINRKIALNLFACSIIILTKNSAYCSNNLSDLTLTYDKFDLNKYFGYCP